MTQMGNQGHATEGARLTNEWIQAGMIGEVREVHAWSDRAGRLWKQGIGRPTETPPVPHDARLEPLARPGPRASLSSDLRAGQLERAGGTSAAGPWATWAATSSTTRCGPSGSGRLVVEARSTIDGSILEGNKRNFETYPIASIITFEFPARGRDPPVQLTWYEGGLMPPTPAEMATPRTGAGCTTTASCTSAARGRCTTAPTAACRSFCRRRCTKRRPRSPRR